MNLLINEKNDIENPSDSPPIDFDAINYATFTGNFVSSRVIAATGSTDYFAGKTEGCFEGDNDPPSGTYHYYRVLLAR